MVEHCRQGTLEVWDLSDMGLITSSSSLSGRLQTDSWVVGVLLSHTMDYL